MTAGRAGLVCWALVACVSAGQSAGDQIERPAPVARAPDTVVAGVVAVVGAHPLTQVVIGSPGAVEQLAVVGALSPEVATLHGAEVRVWGLVVRNGHPVPPRAIEATRYEIVAINGERPFFGVLVGQNGEFWVAGQRLIELPAELRAALGAKVWVLGRRVRGGLLVTSYGIIAPRL